MGKVLTNPDREVEPAVLPATQLDKTEEVGGGDDARSTGVDE
jgi:hypothetical protein